MIISCISVITTTITVITAVTITITTILIISNSINIIQVDRQTGSERGKANPNRKSDQRQAYSLC